MAVLQLQKPRNYKEAGIYFREILKMDNFRYGVKNRLQYALLFGGIDLSSRLAVYRYLPSGLYSSFGTVDVYTWRKWGPTFLAGFLTSWISAPLEVAKSAYYGDKTFPKELQKGYKSVFNALVRIPFTEGPYYFFKNSSPLIARNTIMTSTLFLLFEFIQDKLSPIWRSGESPRFLGKLL